MYFDRKPLSLDAMLSNAFDDILIELFVEKFWKRAGLFRLYFLENRVPKWGLLGRAKEMNGRKDEKKALNKKKLMTHSFFLLLWLMGQEMKYVRFVLSSEEENANVSALRLEIKSNDLLLSQSLKVEEKKAS